ncbi:glycosyltransferase [Actinokineospora sp. PR83]|uniref:glycosyltransferase n=1 Tax=Actinokineospora sp. PR83 TaxID=2884908 RepID=UPI0027E1C7EF|nr:glycosyltransferase [Actinokineospora sp. PR83]
MLTDVLVPGNRWDLLTPYPIPTPRVSVVVTHYEQPRQLERTCLALHRQTAPPLEIIIADDGSATPPTPPTGGPPTHVVRQSDRGFRAAAARNLGARHSSGEVLVFLDADTVPEPDFLREIVRTVSRSPDALAVGRRRHADFTTTAPDAHPATATHLPEPAWLTEGYQASRNLLDADGRSFRHVISALLACRTTLFEDLNGFDERFTGYGGEDWDLGYRAWNAGAVLVHERSAIAWHDGPDWEGRDTDREALDRQSARLAALIPEPSTRGAALPADLPDVLVDLTPAADPFRTTHSLLRQDFRDLKVRLPPGADPAARELYGRNAQTEAWTSDQLRRCRARLHARGPLPPGAVTAAMDLLVGKDLAQVTLTAAGDEVATLTSTRSTARAHRWRNRFSAEEIRDQFGTAHIKTGPPPPPRATLAGYFDKRDHS